MSKFSLITVILLAQLLSGCSETSNEQLLSNAKQNIELGKHDEAVIGLKSLLQKSPEDSEARLLLGELYVQTGSANAAIKELEIAVELGADKKLVFPLLASAYLISSDIGGFAILNKQLDKLGSTEKITVLAFNALLELQLGNVDGAQSLYKQIQKERVQTEYVTLVGAGLDFAAGDFDKALLKINDLNIIEASLIKGKWYLSLKHYTDAVNSLKEYTSVRIYDLSAKIILANAQLFAGEFDEAELIVEPLLALNPSQPFLNYLKGSIAFSRGNFIVARNHTEKAIQNGYDRPEVRVIAALSSFKTDNFERSFENLDKIRNYLESNPSLASLYYALGVKLGYLESVFETIGAQTSLGDTDIAVLSALSVELLDAGEVDKAREINKKLNEYQLSSSDLLVTRALSQLALNDDDAILSLEKALNLDSESEAANTLLARVYLSTGQYQQALDLAKEWQAKNPANPAGFSLEGITYQYMQNQPKAEKAFLLALEIEPSDVLANLFFADQRYKQKSYDDSAFYLKQILTANPTNLPALSKLFSLHMLLGQTDEGLMNIEKALAIKSDKPKARLQLLYAAALFDSGRKNQAANFLSGINSADMPDEYWLIIGNSFYQTDQIAEAVASAYKWVELEPENAAAHLRLISMLKTTGQKALAFKQVGEAIKLFSMPIFKLIGIDLAVAQGDLFFARSMLGRLDIDTLNTRIGMIHKGQYLLENGNTVEAISLLLRANSERVSNKSLWLLSRAYIQNGEPQKAYELFTEYVDVDSADTEQLVQFAELAIKVNKTSQGADIYKKIIVNDSSNLRALNNLAALYYDEGNYEKSYDLAKQAFKLYPDNLLVVNTFAYVSWKYGDLESSILAFKKLYTANPSDPAVIQAFSDVLKQSGQTKKASLMRATLN